VNDELVAEVQDELYSRGDVGLIAISGEQPGGKVRFTSFLALQP